MSILSKKRGEFDASRMWVRLINFKIRGENIVMRIAIDAYESCDFEIVLETHIHGKDWSTELPKSFSKQNMCIVNISERITKKNQKNISEGNMHMSGQARTKYQVSNCKMGESLSLEY